MSEEDHNVKSAKRKASLTEAEQTAARLQMIRDYVAAPRSQPETPSEEDGLTPEDIPSASETAPSPAPAMTEDEAASPHAPPPQTAAARESKPSPPPEAPAKAGEANEAPDVKLPDPVALGQAMFNLMEKSQPLIRDFMERMKLNPPENPAAAAPVNLAAPWMHMTQHFWQNPQKVMNAQLGLWQDYMKLWQNTTRRFLGQPYESVIAAQPNDKRFADEAWTRNTLFDFIKQSYLLTAQWLQKEVKETEGIDAATQRKAEFYARQFIDAIAPSNFVFTNPEVLRMTAETGGENLVKGLQNLLQDLERGKGHLRISMTDEKAFELGKNIAATPGKVVFQNGLMQLIQYAPLTETVHAAPLLIIPPWINKYYILDMREKNSFVRFCLEQGHQVFMISWANPDETMAAKDFNAYMQEGPLAALVEIKRRTGAESVNILGYCLGGTLLACMLAYLQARPERASPLPRIASASYLVTMIDFSEPGELGIFMDEEHLQFLEKQMAEKGYLDAQIMMQTFSLLRANDLIWSFVVNNYLLGREPFPFDLLYWNSDATRMPAAMHSFYLRKMYQENKLIEPGGIKLDGTPIDVRRIDTPSFLLATREDHIAPWKSTYAATQIYGGPVTFVLSGSGHVAGVINPPANKKYGYWMNDQLPEAPDEWLNGAAQHSGSWWTAWMEWLKPYQGGDIPALPPAAPVLEDSPGSYVRVRVV